MLIEDCKLARWEMKVGVGKRKDDLCSAHAVEERESRSGGQKRLRSTVAVEECVAWARCPRWHQIHVHLQGQRPRCT